MNKKPLNNYNPNLSKKGRSNSNTNILNRPGTSNTKGPVKITSNNISYPKKPSTPDQFYHIRRSNNQDNKMVLFPGIMKRPSSKTRSDVMNRPSTAPQKDKKGGLGGTMIIKGNSHYSGPNRRLPSPQIHTSGFGGTQKLNPSRYRAPSPVVKSGLNMGGTFKRMGSYQKI